MMVRTPAAAAFAIAGALIVAGPALASPEQPDPPPSPPPPATAGLLGIPALPDLAAYGPNMLLGQNPVPAAPGEPVPGVPTTPVVPNLSAFNPDYLLGQNVNPAAPGEGNPAAGLAPNADIPGTGRISFLHRLYEMYQSGGLTGALLGQQSPEEFAEQSVTPPQ